MASPPLGPWAATGFAAGTFVQTARGLRPIERLEPGEDELEFRDGSTGPLLHLWRATFSAEELAADPSLRPLTIPALALGSTVPARPLVASQSVRIHAQGRLVNRVTEVPEVLLPLSALLQSDGVELAQPPSGMTYYHLVTDRHEVLRVEGLMCETLYLGDGADPALREAVETQTGALDHTAVFPRINEETATRLTAKLAKKNRAPTSAEAE